MRKLKITKRTIPDLISKEIIKYIEKKQLIPGDKLPSQRELSLQLGVGRPSIREALHKLEIMGVVKVEHGKKTTIERLDINNIMRSVKNILEISPTDVLSLIEARQIIETGCVELAAERAIQDDLSEMEKYLNEMRKNRMNFRKHAKADFSFHLSIIKASKNKAIIEVMKVIGGMIQSAIEKVAVSGTSSGKDEALIAHREILKAIHEKNKEKAAYYLREHLERAKHEYSRAVGN